MKKGTGIWITVLIYSFIIMTLMVPVCTAQETEVTPRITYFIQFQELNTETANKFKASIMMEENDAPSGVWQVITGEELFYFNWEHPITTDVRFNGGSMEEYFQGSYDAQLTTIENEPVSVKIGESIIELRANDILREDFFLEIGLTPENIDYITGRVLTSFDLKQASYYDAVNNKTTVWVGPEFHKPIAVISREITGHQSKDRKYFAVYLAVIINIQSKDRGNNILPAANISGFNRLFVNNSSNRQETNYLFKLSLSGREVVFNTIGDSGIKRYYLGVQQTDQAIYYKLGFDYALYYNELLFLTAQLSTDNNYGQTPVVMFGLIDEKQWFDILNLRIAFLPLKFHSTGGVFAFEPLTLINAEVPVSKLSFWYKGELSKGFSSHYLGISCDLSELWGLEVGYKGFTDREGRISFGLNWKTDI